MDSGLSKKTAIVTGASGGIGRAIVRLFSNEGARIAAHYNTGRERAERLVAGLASTSQAVALGANLTDEKQVANLFEKSEANLGPPHILIANAGVWPRADIPISQMSLDRWNQTTSANLTSVFLCCKAFLSSCDRNSIEDPAIVLIGSTAGFFGEANHGDYAASKGGLMTGLMQTLKNEIPKTLRLGRINTVCPGWTMTPMAKAVQDDPEMMKRVLQTIPLRKFAAPSDIAKSVLFFASNEFSGHVTGQNLFVSGGMEGRILYSPDEIDVTKAVPDEDS